MMICKHGSLGLLLNIVFRPYHPKNVVRGDIVGDSESKNKVLVWPNS